MNAKTHPLIKQLYPWIVWLLAASFFYYKYLVQVSPGVMSSQLMSAFSLSGAELGNLAACFFYAYFIMQIPVGLILDRWSPRKITAFAAFSCAAATWFFANSDSLGSAALCRFIIGLGASFAAVSCFKLASLWFPPKRFALVAGLSMTAAMLGAVGGQGPLSYLVGQFGWRQALQAVAILGVILSCFIWIIIRDNKSQCQSKAEQTDITIFKQLSMILKLKQTWILSLYSGFAFAPISVFGGLWGVSFIEKAYHLNSFDAANIVSLIFIGFAIGCPLAGWLSDHFEKRKPLMTIGTVIALISISAVIYLPLSKQLLQFTIFAFGLGASCFFICFAVIREIHPLIFTATVLGFMNAFDAICEAVTEPLIGKILDMSWSGVYENGARAFMVEDYHIGLMLLPIYLFIAQIFLFFVKETHCIQKA